MFKLHLEGFFFSLHLWESRRGRWHYKEKHGKNSSLVMYVSLTVWCSLQCSPDSWNNLLIHEQMKLVSLSSWDEKRKDLKNSVCWGHWRWMCRLWHNANQACWSPPQDLMLMKLNIFQIKMECLYSGSLWFYFYSNIIF